MNTIVVNVAPEMWGAHESDHLERIARQHPGDAALCIRFVDRPVLQPVWGCRVSRCASLMSSLRSAFGPDVVADLEVTP